MKIIVLKETKHHEKRVALTPAVAQQFIKLGYSCLVETNAGYASNFDDEAYLKAGCEIISSKADALKLCDVVIKVNAPTVDEISLMKSGSILISYLYHAFNPELVGALAKQGVSAFSMDAMPRISRAQSMDALSSQNNLAGYKAVIIGADALGKIFPLMMTAGGTITPSRVLIFGAGVAGLQAVATAKRLGAIVEVTDVRPETKEQVESLGGKFIEVKGEGVQVEGGYAKEVSADYLQKQKEAVNKSLAQADLVITTALVAGKKAPVLITEEQVKLMKLGSVIVDMAVEQGGNCALSEADNTVVKHGVTIVGRTNLPSTLAQNASELYAKNIYNFLTHLSTKDGMKWEFEEEITKGTLITHQQKTVHPSLQTATA
ncbi:MAG: Re/Si-specific NAD(P)(+) transhydrogenase subunit alpha [Bacteroidetes bacterium]|nr:MAG: Re/Si-specific NAD(P)(+) transhydrogenase subunit alpha [Bacteroidota bacterium]